MRDLEQVGSFFAWIEWGMEWGPIGLTLHRVRREMSAAGKQPLASPHIKEFEPVCGRQWGRGGDPFSTAAAESSVIAKKLAQADEARRRQEQQEPSPAWCSFPSFGQCNSSTPSGDDN